MLNELTRDKLPQAFIFTSPTGLMLNPRNWRKRVFKKAVATAKLDSLRDGDLLRPHDLRHLANSLLAERGVSEGTRRAVLRHASSEVNALYLHETTGMGAEVVRALEAMQPKHEEVVSPMVTSGT